MHTRRTLDALVRLTRRESCPGHACDKVHTTDARPETGHLTGRRAPVTISATNARVVATCQDLQPKPCRKATG